MPPTPGGWGSLHACYPEPLQHTRLRSPFHAVLPASRLSRPISSAHGLRCVPLQAITSGRDPGPAIAESGLPAEALGALVIAPSARALAVPPPTLPALLAAAAAAAASSQAPKWV